MAKELAMLFILFKNNNKCATIFMVILMKETVLCYLFKEDKCLMLYRNKKENDLNQGKYIGVGGKIEDGETPEVALIREVREETGYFLNGFTKRGEILFQNDDYSEYMHLYTSNTFFGKEIKCDEGDLVWVSIDDILNLNLWEGDKVFLKMLLLDEPFFIITVMMNLKDGIIYEI